MSRIATLPQPPYYAVIAPAVLRPDVAGERWFDQYATRIAHVMEAY